MASIVKPAAAAGDIRLRGIAEAADALRCSRQTIYRLARDGDLRLIKIRAKTLVAGIDDVSS